METSELFQELRDQQESERQLAVLKKELQERLAELRREVSLPIAEGLSRQVSLLGALVKLVARNDSTELTSRHPNQMELDPVILRRSQAIPILNEDGEQVFAVAHTSHRVIVEHRPKLFLGVKVIETPETEVYGFGLTFFTNSSPTDENAQFTEIGRFRGVKDWDVQSGCELSALDEAQLFDHFYGRLPDELTEEYQNKFAGALELVEQASLATS